MVTGEGRKVPQTEAERSDALRSMIAYTGKHRVEDGKIITKVQAAWNEAWVTRNSRDSIGSKATGCFSKARLSLIPTFWVRWFVLS
jgi:hypothetical protein